MLNIHDLLEIPTSFYARHRETLVRAMKQIVEPPAKSICLFKGVPTISIEDQDIEQKPQQYDSFMYLFGVEEPDCYGAIEFDTGKSIVFVERVPDSAKLWIVFHDKDWFLNRYQVDEIRYCDEIEKYLQDYTPSRIYLNNGINSDSRLKSIIPTFEFLRNYPLDLEFLYPTLAELRTVKDQKEIEIMQFIGKITAEAHIRVMKNVKPGLKEYQLETLFKFHFTERCGGFGIAYQPICASGRNAATLHYNINCDTLPDNALILADMGGHWKNYCSDITTTFPSNGKFTQKQKDIYNAVLDAVLAVEEVLKEGQKWDEMHLLAERVVLKHLIKLGLVREAPIEELIQKRVATAFFPHGLGHFIGCRCHDVGGYNKGCPERRPEIGLKFLRTCRPLRAGNAITVEPGIYFIKLILAASYADPNIEPFLVKEKIDEYFEVGGVRIEEDVIVTKDGIINLCIVPRTIEEVEACMAEKDDN